MPDVSDNIIKRGRLTMVKAFGYIRVSGKGQVKGDGLIRQEKAIREYAESKGIEILKGGYMVGPYALIMRYCAERNVPAVALLAEAFYKYPDPEAAAATIREFSKISGLKMDLSKLIEKGEEIRLKARDVMKRTERELSRMKKTQEYDLPLYV